MKLGAIVAGLLLLFVGYTWGQRATPIVTVTDTVSLAAMNERLASERRTSEGLRARLAAIEQRQPDTVFVTDTLIPAPDTVMSFVSVRGSRLTTQWLIGDSLRAPSLTVTTVGDCDDGFEVSAAGVLCDRARLGHLWIGPLYQHTDPMLAAWWKPSYRSAWELGVGYGTQLHVFIRYGLRLF